MQSAFRINDSEDCLCRLSDYICAEVKFSGCNEKM